MHCIPGKNGDDGMILTLCETCFASSGLTQDCGAADTQHHCLGVAEHRRDLVASWRGEKQKLERPSVDPRDNAKFLTQQPLQMCDKVQCVWGYLDISHP